MPQSCAVVLLTKSRTLLESNSPRGFLPRCIATMCQQRSWGHHLKSALAGLLILCQPAFSYAQGAYSTIGSSVTSSLQNNDQQYTPNVPQNLDTRLPTPVPANRITGADNPAVRRAESGNEYFFPEPPSEFQNFVFHATGQWLRIFGADLFQGV